MPEYSIQSPEKLRTIVRKRIGILVEQVRNFSGLFIE
jgi:hypothetical protein